MNRQVVFDGIGMDSVVDLRNQPTRVPFQFLSHILGPLEPFEFLDEVQLELWTNPHAKLKCDILVRIRTTITTSLCPYPNCVCLSNPFFGADFIIVEADLAFNYGELAIIKIRIVHAFPDT